MISSSRCQRRVVADVIAVCVHNRSSMLAEHQRGRLGDLDSEYSVSIGERYIVVGMGIWENVLHFLVRDDWRMPTFMPAGLFDCPAQSLPEGWGFSLQPGIAARGRDLWVTPCAALWGYEQLLADPEHAGLLGERDDAAMLVFFQELMAREAELNE
mgnify:CR=1 FL=1